MKRSFKPILLFFVCFCTVFSFCGCTLIVNRFKVDTRDLNGEYDYSLATLTDDEICAENNVCYCVLLGLSRSGEKSYDDGTDPTHDADDISVTAYSPLSGVCHVQSTYSKEDTVTFTVECTHTKGNLRIVLLNENYDIIHDFSITEKSSFTVNNAKGKEFSIRVAGEDSLFELKATREFSK